MKKVTFVRVDPGGNPTILVLSRVLRQKQPIIAKQIMNETNTLGCEQVGFIESAKLSGAFLRLQMMGGEFCGNGLRAVAAWLAKTASGKNQIKLFRIETSGSNKIVQTSAKSGPNGRIRWAETEIPEPKVILKGKIDLILAKGDNVSGRVVRFQGITNVLLPRASFRKNLDFEAIFRTLLKNPRVGNQALGLIFYKKLSSNSFSMLPVIFVVKTKTLVFETSCASGAVALALIQGLQADKTIFVRQPSRYILMVRMETRKQRSKIFIKGKVREVTPEKTFG